jgi:hypothetical protein
VVCVISISRSIRLAGGRTVGSAATKNPLAIAVEGGAQSGIESACAPTDYEEEVLRHAKTVADAIVHVNPI